MSFFRVQSEFVYRFITDDQRNYYVTLVVDETGEVGVRDWVAPNGPVRDPNTVIPGQVQFELSQAIQSVRDIMAATTVTSGQLEFTGETSKEVVFDTPLSSTNYRVHLDAPDFISTRVKYKAPTGFIVDVGVTYTGIIGFDVFTG